VLTDHWDGYANNQNNSVFYHDPTSDRFHFIPWGIDALFTGRPRTTRPMSVFACGSMPWRLYDVPATQALYLGKLRALLGSVWNEPAILAEIARMQALIEPIADPTGAVGLAAEIQRVRDFVTARRAVLEAELDAGPPVWPYPAGAASCRINVGSLTATFNTAWDTLDNFAAGTATMAGTVSGVALTSSTGYASSGPSDGKAAIQLFVLLPDGRYAVVFVIHDLALLAPGTRPIDLANIAAVMMFYDPVTDTASGGGLMLNGSVTLTSASTVPDAPIVGSLSGDVIEL
jgi:hypothetical protein